MIEYVLTGVGDAKKSISFPIVNGTDKETEEETRSSPTAINNGFCSGLARRMILRKEEEEGEEDWFVSRSSSESVEERGRSRRRVERRKWVRERVLLASALALVGVAVGTVCVVVVAAVDAALPFEVSFFGVEKERMKNKELFTAIRCR